jgi:hypothetical protein
LYIIRGSPQAFHLAGKAFEGALLGGAVFPAMILTEPDIKGCVYLLQGVAAESRQELCSYCFEESFDLALALGLIWLCMYQGDTQCGGGIFKLAGAECRTVIDIQFSGQTPFGDGGSKGIHEGDHCFGEVKLTVWNQAGMVVDKGDQVAFALLVA